MSQAGGATSSTSRAGGSGSGAGSQTTLERWLVNRILKKGVPSLSPEEVSVIHSSMPAFEEAWRAATNLDLPPDVRKQLEDRLAKKEPHIRFEDLDQVPAFHRAVVQGDITRVRSLLQKNVAHVNRLLQATDTGKKTAVHMAAKEGLVGILQLLVENKADIDAKDRTGRNPLHIACEYGQAGGVQLLLKLQVAPEAQDGLGRNAFHLACCSESLQSIEYLLSRKPKLLESVDKHQRTGLFYAVLNTHASGAGEIIAQKLLDTHADANFRDAYRKTPLHYCCEENRKKCAILLLKYRADPAAQDGINRMTPLQVCTSDSLKRDIRKFLGIPEDSAIMSGNAGEGNADPASAGPARRSGGSQQTVAASGSAKKVEFELAEQTHQQGYDAKKIQPAVARAPVALGLSFAQLRERFIRLMQRVQEGGLQQYEHIKSPHLFTASWMQDVSSHQQLLGVTLSRISGPETAIRVFNLLRPPSHFPAARGDERDILSYYSVAGDQGGAGDHGDKGSGPWDGADDPFKLLSGSTPDLKEVEFGQARKQDLIKEIFELRNQVESKDCANEELKKRNAELALKCESYLSPEDVRGYKDELARLRTETTDLELGKQALEGKVAKGESENRILRQELESETAAASRFKTELGALKARLEAEMSRQGEETAWKTVKDRIELQLDELERDKALLQSKVAELETRLQKSGSINAAEEQDLRRLERRARAAEEAAERERLRAVNATEQAADAELQRSRAQAELDLSTTANRQLEQRLGEWQAKYKSVMSQRAQEQYSEVAKLVGLEQETERLKRQSEAQQATIANLERQPTFVVGKGGDAGNIMGDTAGTIGGGSSVSLLMGAGVGGRSPGAESNVTAKTIRNGGQETAMDTMGTDVLRGLTSGAGAAVPGGGTAGVDADSPPAGEVKRASLVERQDTIIPPELLPPGGPTAAASSSTRPREVYSLPTAGSTPPGSSKGSLSEGSKAASSAAENSKAASSAGPAGSPLIPGGATSSKPPSAAGDEQASPDKGAGAGPKLVDGSHSLEFKSDTSGQIEEPLNTFTAAPAKAAASALLEKADEEHEQVPPEEQAEAEPAATASATSSKETAARVAAISAVKGELTVRLLGAAGIANADSGGLSDPYAVIRVPSGPSGKEKHKRPLDRTVRMLKIERRTTHHLSDTLNPIWHSHDNHAKPFEFVFHVDWPKEDWPSQALTDVHSAASHVEVEVLDADTFGSEYLGLARVPLPTHEDDAAFPAKEGWKRRLLVALARHPKASASLPVSGELVLELKWAPSSSTSSGATNSSSLRLSTNVKALAPLKLSGPTFAQNEFTSRDLRQMCCGELTVWVRKGVNLEGFKKMFGGTSCAPYVKVSVPRVPITAAAGATYADKHGIWQTATQKGADPVWEASHVFFIMWTKTSPQLDATFEVFHEGTMSATFLGELSLPIPRQRVGRQPLPNGHLVANPTKRKDSGKQGELMIEYAFEPFFG